MPERGLVSNQAPTTRRQMREAERHSRRSRRRRNPARWVPRTLVLGVLGAGTIVAPVSGLTKSEEPRGEPEVSVEASDHSILDRLEAAATRHDMSSRGDTAALRADDAAPSRAQVQSSRANPREEQKCGPSSDEAANGTRVSNERNPVVEPLISGTYRHTSSYGQRLHPTFGSYAMHTGTDMSAPAGSPIMSVAEGVVRHAGEGIDGRSSMLIIIEHEVDGEMFFSWYVHMYPDGVNVDEGQEVSAGEVIGEVGNNGNSTGPHLHLEIHLDDQDTTTDPVVFLAERDAEELAGPRC